MILVAGGTGTLGRVLTARLTAAGHDVRVLTRDPSRAEGLRVDVAIGDVRAPATLATAVEGASVVVSAVHGFLGGRGAGPVEIDIRGNANLVRASLEAGVGHFVLVSALDARADHPLSLHRAKYAAEQQLRTSGLGWTVLRPSSYVETWIGVVGAQIPHGGPALVLGRGENPINFVSVHDVAALAERATGDRALRGQVVEVPGPDNLSMTELAGHLGAPRARHVPRGALRLLSAVLAPAAPGVARRMHAAVVMDTMPMSADASALRSRFPDLTWHGAAEIADRSRAVGHGA